MKRIGLLFTGVSVATFCLAPLGWQLVKSLQSERGRLTIDNYVASLAEPTFVKSIFNSIVVATATALCCMTIGAAAAFAIAKLEFKGRRFLLAAALAISMFPPVATTSPLFLILRGLGLRDTLGGLVLPYTSFALPLTLWILSSFFREIPDDLYGAARLDGCSPFRAFRKVFLLLAAPGLVTTGILVFIFAWNEFLFALTFISSPGKRTVPVAISLFAAGQKEPWHEIFAACTIVTLPLIALTIVFQRKIVSGLTSGAVKGV